MKQVLVSFLIVLLLPVMVVSQRAELKKIEQKIQANKQAISKKRRKKQQMNTQLGTLRKNLYVEKKRLRQAQGTLNRYQNQILLTKQALQSLEQQEQRTQVALASRLQDMYKKDTQSWVHFLFSPQEYFDRQTDQYYFNRIIDHDTALIEKLHTQRTQKKNLKQQLSRQIGHVKKNKNKIQRSKQSLAYQSSLVSQKISSLQKEIAKFEYRNRLLEQESRQIANVIRSQQTGKRIFYAIGSFIKPAKGWLSSRFGRRLHPIYKRYILHSGIDLAAPTGYQIRASNAGYVIYAGWQKGYGNVTIIDHGWTEGRQLSSVYAHQSRIVAKKGQYVKKEQLIGYVGSTGYSTGPHLHFEMRVNGTPVNPLRYVKL